MLQDKRSTEHLLRHDPHNCKVHDCKHCKKRDDDIENKSELKCTMKCKCISTIAVTVVITIFTLIIFLSNNNNLKTTKFNARDFR
jgi:hypothetical protein